MSYEDLRKEFESRLFRERMKEEHPPICSNCGSKKNIEYHHIVPLKLGGTNSLANIAPLCHKCHSAAHKGRHMSHYADSANSGRKSIASIEKNAWIFDMFINGEIGNSECSEALGYSNQTRIGSRSVFKKYIASKGIKHVRNIVDIAVAKRNNLNAGDIVGEIEYMDGRTEFIYFKGVAPSDIDISDTELEKHEQIIAKKNIENSEKRQSKGKRVTGIPEWEIRRSQLLAKMSQTS